MAAGDERKIMRIYECMSALTGWYNGKSAYMIFFVFAKKKLKSLIALLWFHWKSSNLSSLIPKYFTLKVEETKWILF